MAILAVVAAGASGSYYVLRSNGAQANNPAPAAAAPMAMPVSVASVEPRDVTLWDEFSGPARSRRARRGAVPRRGRGAIRSFSRRRAGEAGRPADHHRSRALYGRGRPRCRRSSTPRRRAVLLTRSDFERGEQLSGSRIISQRDLDQRLNASREAEANLAAARAALQTEQAQPRLYRGARAGRRPRRQTRNHGRQPGCRRARRAGADHAGLASIRSMQASTPMKRWCRARSRALAEVGASSRRVAHPGAYEHHARAARPSKAACN